MAITIAKLFAYDKLSLQNISYIVKVFLLFIKF